MKSPLQFNKEYANLPLHVIRVALYIRVSTEEQAMHGYSLQAQEDCLLQYAEEHHYKIAGIYRDEGNSARKPITKRKVVLQLLDDVKEDKIDLILFVKLDRWTRNVEAYHSVQRILDAHNVSWEAALEDYETLTANGRFKVNIMLSVNESESDRTSERIKFVFESKRQRKEWCFTGPRWPYGYKPEVIDGVKRCVKDPELEPIVQDFWDYTVKYSSVRKAGMYCCQKYGITKHYRSWMAMARHDFYTGTFCGVEGYCEPYVRKEDWERIILSHQVIKKTQKPERVYLFTGIIRCPVCGNTLKATFKTYPHDRTKEYYGYRCNNSKLRLCSFGHQLSEKKIEKYLLANIKKDMQEFISQVESTEKEKRQHPKVHDIVALQEQLRRLNVVYMAGNVSDEEYVSSTKKIKSDIEKAKLENDEHTSIDLSNIKSLLAHDLLAGYDALPKEEQRRFWRTIIEEIYVDGCNVTGVKLLLR